MPRNRAYSCDSRAQITGECSSHSASARTLESYTVPVLHNDELAELKECFRKQQTLLNAILERLGSSQNPSIHHYASSGP